MTYEFGKKAPQFYAVIIDVKTTFSKLTIENNKLQTTR